jgi:dTDP-glucose 4,6-dehydratase
VYDESKRFAEALTIAYNKMHQLDSRIIRIFNCYGPRLRLDDGRVISNFISQSLAGEPLTVYGDGSQTRSFQYVSDLIEGIVRTMNCEHHLPINLGNPNEKTVLEIARLVKELTGSKSEIVFKELPQDDPRRRLPDITKAKQLLDWSPRVELVDGLTQTIAWFKTQVGAVGAK